jgi:pentatricopeptide repeat protein
MATLDPLPPGYAIQDVLLVSAKALCTKHPESRSFLWKANHMVKLIRRLLEDLPPGYMPLSQRTFGILAKKLPAKMAKELHNMLTKAGARLHPNTDLHFARKLAGDAVNAEHKSAAFDILKTLADNGANLNDPATASVITSLLHWQAAHESSSSFSPSLALQHFMERGFIPNVITLTAYIDTLCQRREVEEAIRIAQLFSANGLQLDNKIFATLFRGVKNSHKAGSLRDVLELSKKVNAPQSSLMDNSLHALLYFSASEFREKREDPHGLSKPFLPMLEIYADKFDLEPLQWLIPDSLPLLLAQESMPAVAGPSRQGRTWEFESTVLPVVKHYAAASQGAVLQPTTTTLATMMRAYIQSLSRPYELMSLYTYFKSRLQEKTTSKNVALDLVREQGSIIHDAFILAMMHQPGLTRPALEVFGDMLKDNLKDAAHALDGEPVASPIHPLPSVFTFTILLNGLLSRQEMNLAEQVIQVMKEYGVAPNIVTWNTLIKGYAAMQNLPRTVGALQDLEASGFKPDEDTFSAFARLKKQKQALRMMDSIIDLNKRKIDGQHSLP